MKRAAHKGSWLTLALVVVSIVSVASVRARLADVNRHVKETSDVYVLPPPRQVVTLSLGYRSALADLLWAHVLVSQGLHTFEKRRFENLSLFIDSINELEPTFREPYLLADALYTFQPTPATREEVYKARAVMERGVKELPLDGELWLVLGQFVAYIGPDGYLSDPAEQEQWRLDGARMLSRAAELGGDKGNIAWQALGGAGILNRAGKRDAALRFLERALAVTEDPELKDKIQRQLSKLAAEAAQEERIERDIHRQKRFTELHARDLPSVKRSPYLLLGPPIDAAYCAGPAHEREARCALTWRDWMERQDD